MLNKILLMTLFLNAIFAFAQVSADNVSAVASQENVDKLAEFPGGINNFRTFIFRNFKGEKLKVDKGTLETTVSFTINEDGTLSDIKATGNNQAMNKEIVRVISIIKTKWKPAELNGEKVKYNFQMPFQIVVHE